MSRKEKQKLLRETDQVIKQLEKQEAERKNAKPS